MIRLAAFLPCSLVNGPGARAVIWVQGCPLPLCPGCFNPAFLDLNKPVQEISAEAAAERVLSVDGLRGVTFSGGEPFHQAAALARCAAILRSAGLDVVIFTGYTLDTLRDSADPGVMALLAQTDLLIAGPYRADLPCDDPLRSSSNQQLHFLGTIRPEEIDDLHEVELVIEPDGDLRMSGFPARHFAATLRR